MMRWLRRLYDRRRWRAARTALTFDSLVMVAVDAPAGRPACDAIIAIAADDAAWEAMAEFAADLPDMIRDGWFRGIDRWLGGEIPPMPEPEQGSLEQVDPRRYAAMRDAYQADAFAVVAAWSDGMHAATAITETDEHRLDVAEKCEQLAAAIRHGALDDSGGRLEWTASDGDGDAE